MGRTAIGRYECPICGQTISLNGLARTSHNRKHVKDGLMTESKSASQGISFNVTPGGWTARKQRIEMQRRFNESQKAVTQ